MKKSKFMVQDYPELIKYFASVNPIHLFLYVLPVVLVISSVMNSYNMNFSVIFFLFGMIYWTFLEYLIHRYLYHSHFKNRIVNYFIGSFHLYHHANLKDHRVLNSGLLMILIVAPTVVAPFLLFLNLSQVLSIMLGLSSFYYIYECVHYLIHYREYRSGYMAYIQKYHMQHHQHSPNKNFGNTSHIWDLLLGTYDPKYKEYRMSLKVKESLITNSSKVFEGFQNNI